MKITITVPQSEKEKWTISFGGGLRRRKSALIVFNALRRHLYLRNLREKTSILVKYGKDTTNETIPSLDPNYLLFASSCFLEDYLSKLVVQTYEKKYIDSLDSVEKHI